MRPTCSVFIDQLRSTRKHLLAIGIGYVQGVGGRIVDVSRAFSLGMKREIPENWFNESIIGRN